MHRALDVRPAAHNAAVQSKPGTIDARALIQVVVHADLDEVGSGYLGVQQFVALDEKVPRVGRHAHRGMIENDVAPAMAGQQAIDGGQIDAGLPVNVGGAVSDDVVHETV